jgi:hypothetical protein
MAEKLARTSGALLDFSQPASQKSLTFEPSVQAPAKAEPQTIVTASKVSQKDLPDSFKQATADFTSVLTAQPAPKGQSAGTKRKGKVQASKRQEPSGTRMETRSHTKVEEVSKPPPATRTNPPRGSKASSSSSSSDGSVAGGFRGGTGSGQIGAVCGSSSPARKPGS